MAVKESDAETGCGSCNMPVGTFYGKARKFENST